MGDDPDTGILDAADRGRVGPERVEHIRLAVYGSLAPGEVNHDQLAGLEGRWETGWVRGHLHDRGWGAAEGFPGLVPDPEGERVPVSVFHSADLPEHWSRLDRFEGVEYERVVAEVGGLEDGTLPCSIYVLRKEARP